MRIDKALLAIPFGIAACIYGWWCLARTESAMNFLSMSFLGDSANRDITKFRGILAAIIGPIMIIFAILYLLNVFG